jgi:hypothetical protein
MGDRSSGFPFLKTYLLALCNMFSFARPKDILELFKVMTLASFIGIDLWQ